MIIVFRVGNNEYTVKFSKEKFQELDHQVSANLLIELVSKFDREISDQTLNSLFVLGLEDAYTGKGVPKNEAEIHYKRLKEKNGTEELKKIITVILYRDRSEFFQAVKAMK